MPRHLRHPSTTLLSLAVSLPLVALGAGPVRAASRPALAATAAAEAVDPVAAALARAKRRHRPLVVLFRAEWCEPCNELGAKVLEKPEFAQLSKGFELLSLDHDTPEGAAAGARLGVLGLPTTLVLRLTQKGPPVELGRIEGFDDAAGWRLALQVALQREQAAAPCPMASLPQGGGGWEQIPCAIEALRGPEATQAAAWLEPYIGGVPRSGSGAQNALRAASSLARYWLRVRSDPAHCAALMAKAWPSAGNNLSAAGSTAYWRAKCLHRAHQDDEALAALDELERRAATADAQARGQTLLLVADLLVHERLAPERAECDLKVLIAADPKDAEPNYLLGRLYRDLGRKSEARAALEAALALQPDKALYQNFARNLQQ